MFVFFVFTATLLAVNVSQFQKSKSAYYPTSTLRLSHFQNVTIDFQPKHVGEYLLFDGNTSYMYLYSKNNYFRLWVMHNGSYEIYTAPYSNSLRFGWPNYTINLSPMKLVLNNGNVTFESMEFHTEVFLGNVNGISADFLVTDTSLDCGNVADGYQEDWEERPTTNITPNNSIKTEIIEDVYKCPPSKLWIIYLMVIIIVALVASLLGMKHELIKTLLGPKISWIIQRCRAFLPGGFEIVSTDNPETDSHLPENQRYLHIAQTYT